MTAAMSVVAICLALMLGQAIGAARNNAHPCQRYRANSAKESG